MDLDTILTDEEPQPRTFPRGAVLAVTVIAMVVWGCIGVVGLFAIPTVATFGNASTFVAETGIQGAEYTIERYLIAAEYGDAYRAAAMFASPLSPAERSRLADTITEPRYTTRVTDVTVRAVEGVPVDDERFSDLDAGNPLARSGPIAFEGTLTYADGSQATFEAEMVEVTVETSFAIGWRLTEELTIHDN